MVLGSLLVGLRFEAGLRVFEIAGSVAMGDTSSRTHSQGTCCRDGLHHIFFCAHDMGRMRYASAGDILVYHPCPLRIST